MTPAQTVVAVVGTAASAAIVILAGLMLWDNLRQWWRGR